MNDAVEDYASHLANVQLRPLRLQGKLTSDVLHRSQTPANETLSGKKGIKDTYRATSSCVKKINFTNNSQENRKLHPHLISQKTFHILQSVKLMITKC